MITQFEGKPRDEAKRNRKGGRGDGGGQRDYSNASKKRGGKQFGKNKFGDKKFGDKPGGGGKPYQKRKPDGEGGSDGSGPKREFGGGFKKKSDFKGDRKSGSGGNFGGGDKKPHRGKRPFEGGKSRGPKAD